MDERSRMQLAPGYLNSFETVIAALEKGGEQAQAAGHVAHGACLLHAAVELRHVWATRKTATPSPEPRAMGIPTSTQEQEGSDE